MKKAIAFVTSLMIITALSACGSTTSETANNDSDKTSDESMPMDSVDEEEDYEGATSDVEEKANNMQKKGSTDKTDDNDYPKIEELEWNVDEIISDGERNVFMSVKNNSKYPINSIEISFSEKKDITEEQKQAFFDELKRCTGATDEEIEDIKSSTREISMYSKSEQLIMPEDSISNANMYYYTGYIYMKSFEQFQYVDPDIAQIEYIDDDLIKKVYYDFKSAKYSMDSKTKEIKKWIDPKIGATLPKLDDVYIDVVSDLDNYLWFNVRGVKFDIYKSYLEKCKDTGYNDEKWSTDEYYIAENSEGYSLSLEYDEDKTEMEIILSKYENDESSEVDE